MRRVMFFFVVVFLFLSSCSRRNAVYYSNDNITFYNNDSRLTFSRLSIDSLSDNHLSKDVALLFGTITERSCAQPPSNIPSRVFILQANKNFQVFDNKFEVELEEGNYDILVYNRTGEAVYHHMFLVKGKTYKLNYKLGEKNIVCRKTNFSTDTFSIKYYGESLFFYNTSDTICMGETQLREDTEDRLLPSGYGKLSIDVYKRSFKPDYSKKIKKAKILIPELFMAKELSENGNEVLLPQGYYTIFIVADQLFPNMVKSFVQEGRVEKLNAFLGFSTLE